jgi:hypothetical protein
VSDRIERLEALLQRVKANSGKPRVKAAAVSAPAPAPISDTRPRSAIPAHDAEEAEPVPLVRVTQASAPPAAPAPVADRNSETPDISVTPFSETGEVSALEYGDAEPLEALTDGDLEDISSDLLESLPPTADVSWSQSEQAAADDEPPVSSQRPRLASGLEDTGDFAPSDREAPLLTPPPESGPQEAPPSAGLSAPGVPDIETLVSESVPPAAISLGPTPEQIGESVELEEASQAALELDVARAHPATIPPKEELEALLGPQSRAGVYDEALMPPPQALDDLEAHDRRQASAPPGEELPPPAFPSEPATHAFTPAAEAPAPAYEAMPAYEAGPEVHAAVLPAGGAPAARSPLPVFRPESFLELLDASIALGSRN